MSLNPLRTKHELSLVIDDVEYKFTYKSVNKKMQQQLDNLRKENISKFEIIDEKRAELNQLKELKALNDEITKDISLIERTKKLLEQKDLVKKIYALEKELKALEDNTISIDEAIEEIYKRYFDLCVVGDGKVVLEKAIEDLGISYTLINKYIDVALKKAIEKK